MAIAREIKERWLERLRSPEAKWAGGLLFDPCTRGMCCLGHLADITNSWYHGLLGWVAAETGVPETGLPADGFCGLSFSEMKALAEANDERGTFPLDLIEVLPVAEES